MLITTQPAVKFAGFQEREKSGEDILGGLAERKGTKSVMKARGTAWVRILHLPRT